MASSSTPNDTPAATQLSTIRRPFEAGPSDLDRTVTITVGPDPTSTPFVLHQSLLTASSRFFTNALKPPWTESTSRTIALSEASPTAFAIYAKFLLTGYLFLEHASESAIFGAAGSEAEAGFSPATVECLDCAHLADFLQATNFADAVADATVEAVGDVRRVYGGEGKQVICMHGAVQNVYMYMKPGAPLRRFFLDLCVHAWGTSGGEVVPTNLDTFDAEILADYITAVGPYLLRWFSVEDHPDPVDARDTCKYHEHVLTGEACYKIKRRYLDAAVQTPEQIE